MVSKLSKYVMGLLHKRPMNPYEVAKLSDKEVIQRWFPMTAASIYTTIKNLEKKGYIAGKSVQEGNFPVKTVYSLSESGEKELSEDLANGLASYEAEASNFGIALFHISSIEKKDALSYLRERLVKLETLLSDTQEHLELYATKIPFNMKMMLIYQQNRLLMEIKTTEELIIEIEKDEKWDYSFTQYLDS
ncbi:PadR family transcriptional regulator [Anaerocolumna chitinilytica]|uniref:Transcription regulator PadR N-terminal domain-containing protein n=1 Tax=Anaerocolumna chitinilytica TaxID=1727145 RepID=A0A7I8DNK7_9FIRM|nr:PadR family transcriptional regulator [Anaerocolumna chitinilytica]BCJ98914.1 hypothetical protein bsdcttw_19550 [Anaerocolumna chitinilytica]